MATTKNTTTGINVNGIAKIQTAIDNYRKEIKSKMDLTATTSEIQKAVKGSGSEADIVNMGKAIGLKMSSYLTNLDYLYSELNQIKESYAKADKNNATFTDTIGIKYGEMSVRKG